MISPLMQNRLTNATLQARLTVDTRLVHCIETR